MSEVRTLEELDEAANSAQWDTLPGSLAAVVIDLIEQVRLLTERIDKLEQQEERS